MLAAAPAMPTNPSNPAIIAMTRKIAAHFNIDPFLLPLLLLQFVTLPYVKVLPFGQGALGCCAQKGHLNQEFTRINTNGNRPKGNFRSNVRFSSFGRAA